MLKPDFSGINPLRVPEARRRIEAIDKYFNLPSPTTADATRIAAGLGISRWQFHRLARAWREHRDPALLIDGPRGRSVRHSGIAQRALEIMREEIANAGASAELCSVAPTIEQRCQAEGVTPPSRPTIWTQIRKERAARPWESGPKRIVVGRMWFHLPVTTDPNLGEGTAMPTLLAVVALPERIILAHRISVDDSRPPAVADLVSETLTLRSLGAEARPLRLEADDRRASRDVLAAGGLGGLRWHKRSVQRELSRAFGGRLGQLPALYQRALARPHTKLVMLRQDKRITPEEAKAAIREAIAFNNAASGLVMPAFDVLDADAEGDELSSETSSVTDYKPHPTKDDWAINT
ncbi:MAG TPA: hypothetical protein VEZ20_03180 [Allosphingosinicella sp.]|jgi:hypothetical protein|nr:hypothetical protein [Allosphingosinicella sp.]